MFGGTFFNQHNGYNHCDLLVQRIQETLTKNKKSNIEKAQC